MLWCVALRSAPGLGLAELSVITTGKALFLPQAKLGKYVEERFTEAAPQACIEAFQKDLQQVTAEIEKRNEGLDLKYEYLLPGLVENSVAI
ncbi:hypothetical protein scyTo_0026616 [Scyliorhinus torazame]|uniref:Lipoxygenase domain-containing protein n=1 Tax=Scyliorhinus torazame TaxID=75743 RepID=A0A401QKP9_SCYTO|nr:hypothetical protein [Scyliorhinus torazame]